MTLSEQMHDPTLCHDPVVEKHCLKRQHLAHEWKKKKKTTVNQLQ